MKKKEKELKRTPRNVHEIYWYGKPTRWERALFMLGFEQGKRKAQEELRKYLGL